MRRRVRIVNDGKPAYMTTVTDTDTGKEFPGLTRVELQIDVQTQVPQATIFTTIFPEVDVIADAAIRQVCPCCGQPVEKSTEDNGTQPLQGA